MSDGMKAGFVLVGLALVLLFGGGAIWKAVANSDGGTKPNVPNLATPVCALGEAGIAKIAADMHEGDTVVQVAAAVGETIVGSVCYNAIKSFITNPTTRTPINITDGNQAGTHTLTGNLLSNMTAVPAFQNLEQQVRIQHLLDCLDTYGFSTPNDIACDNYQLNP
jgi:hypothetical protein